MEKKVTGVGTSSVIRGIFLLSLCTTAVSSQGFESWKRSLSGDWTLNILHNNDMHSRFDETSQRTSPLCSEDQAKRNNCYGGFARVSYLVKKARASSPSTLYLNAGDTFQGSTWFKKDGWKVVAHFLKKLKPDAMCLGNHEFDKGPSDLADFIQDVKLDFPVLASNLDMTLEPKLKYSGIKDLEILSVDGHRVGIIGFVTTETKTTSKGTGKVEFLDEIEAVKKQVKILQEQGINIIIGLGHSGYGREKEIARSVPGLDLVIGGHSNTFLYSGPQPDIDPIEGPYPTEVTQSSGRKVFVVQAGGHTKYLGNLSIVFDKRGEIKKISGNPILLDHTIPQDPEILRELDNWRPKFNTTKVAQTKIFLDGEVKFCRRSECILGNVICDALVDYNAKVYKGFDKWTDAAIAIMHSGTIRSSIETSPWDSIRVVDIEQALTFPDTLDKVTITGAQLLTILEVSVFKLKENDTSDLPGDFLQVSGIKVTYDLSKKPGSRVVRDLLSILCADCVIPKYEPLDVDKNYTVLGPSFLFTGAGSYSIFKTIKPTSLGVNFIDVISDFMTSRSPLQGSVDGRSQFAKHNPSNINSVKETPEQHRRTIMDGVHFVIGKAKGCVENIKNVFRKKQN